MQDAAVFMDRDGTINEEVGYLNHITRFHLYPWAPEAIRLINQNGFKAVVITNQAGVARGYFTEKFVNQVHARMREELANQGATLDAIYYCPHHPTAGEPPLRQNCDCRKPKPGLILKAAQDHHIDLSRSYMIGDRYSDVVLAHNAGVQSIFVLSGYGMGEFEYHRPSWAIQPQWIARDLLEAAHIILSQPGGIT